MSDEKPPGRLLGGLLRVRGRVGSALRSDRAKSLYWGALEGAVGVAVGISLVSIWLAAR
ncbi:hypothetical protein [Streptomyces sp. t39]|uniref:hypothetical protein n=1 Tax=Streptomyces sp. t39 TaxID=1828156 RepID=UPI00165016D6|nr:hypothetical protein [Streptomyces sp. t39]